MFVSPGIGSYIDSVNAKEMFLEIIKLMKHT